MKFAYLIEPPFNYRESDGTVTGCDVELARMVCAELDESFEPVEAEFAELLPGVVDGRWRMTTGLFSTEERRQVASFSRPIWALPDGLLVGEGNPLGLEGYASVERSGRCKLAVIRDQFQHRSAVEFGIPDDRIVIFETYAEAAEAVETGVVDAYASVARAHSGFLGLHPELQAELIIVPAHEKQPAFGSFAFAKGDDGFRASVDRALEAYVGSEAHRTMMAKYGFDDAEIDLLKR
jgi:polar amino acid transport system substrate-binding protein